MTETSESEATDRRRTSGLHLLLFLVLLLCAMAFVFEIHRALAGNSLSWAYVFEWPLLGIFSVYMWYRMGQPEIGRERPNLISSPQIETMRNAWLESQRALDSNQSSTSTEGAKP